MSTPDVNVGPSPGPSRRRRGGDTRRKVEEAAGRLFTEHGYQPTTMQAIADAAGVHVQTVYLAYGTKAAVLAATATRLVAGDEDPDSHPSQRRWAKEVLAAEDPTEKLRLYVRHVRDITPRTIRLIDMLRATAPSDGDVAAFLAHMEEGRRGGPYALLAPVFEAGGLRVRLEPLRRCRHRLRPGQPRDLPRLRRRTGLELEENGGMDHRPAVRRFCWREER